MGSYFFDILNLVVRWFHIIAGIAWIGASFYFVMLDTSLRKPKKREDEERGVFGELWAVHGGGFYQSQKFLMGPQNEPLSEDLHWSKWEAYTTWISGIFLFILIYWFKAEIYLIDPSVMDISKTAAILTSLAYLVGGWIVYDLLCRSPLGNKPNLLSGIIFVLMSWVAMKLTGTFSGRGAYILFGAILGTIMAANVFFIIIPGQKKMVDTIRAGKKPNPIYGMRGKQRSVHNTYFTLPVLFAMISNHFPITFGSEYNWLILILISMSGVFIRVFFVSRHAAAVNGTRPNVLAAGLGVLIMVSTISFIVISRPPPVKINANSLENKILFTQVQSIVQERCVTCHASSPTQPGFAAPPNGIILETPNQIQSRAQLIHQMTVENRTMPIGNITGMTEEERAIIHAWIVGNLEN